ncbi:MAG: hypothetical protein IJ157_10665 [Clostridia bacterium]|nr:hypothetical protein [Clostridia bacterium]
MKKLALVVMALMLCCLLSAALADTYYVNTPNGGTLNLRSAKDDSVIARIPNGTRLETDDNLSTEISAWVTYNGKSGYARWEFLSKSAPSGKSGSKNTKAQATPAPAQQPAYGYDTYAGEGDITITMYGGAVQYSSNGKAYGDRYTAISYDYPQEVVLTADATPEYWVINGTRYDFEPAVPKSIVLHNVWDSLTVEAVFRGGASFTQLSPDDIQAFRTGDQLIVQAIHSKLCHITASGYGAGGWLDWFDFTDDYINRATNQWEQGGQVTTRIRATIPKGKKISYWRFDNMYLDFSTDVTQFVVRTLDVSMEYEPIFNGKISNITAAPKPDTTAAPRPVITPTPTMSFNNDYVQHFITPTPTSKLQTATPGNINIPVTRGPYVQITPTPRRVATTMYITTPTPTPRLVRETINIQTFITPTPTPRRVVATMYNIATPSPTPRLVRETLNIQTFITPTPVPVQTWQTPVAVMATPTPMVMQFLETAPVTFIERPRR